MSDSPNSIHIDTNGNVTGSIAVNHRAQELFQIQFPTGKKYCTITINAVAAFSDGPPNGGGGTIVVGS